MSGGSDHFRVFTDELFEVVQKIAVLKIIDQLLVIKNKIECIKELLNSFQNVCELT